MGGVFHTRVVTDLMARSARRSHLGQQTERGGGFAFFAEPHKHLPGTDQEPVDIARPEPGQETETSADEK